MPGRPRRSDLLGDRAEYPPVRVHVADHRHTLDLSQPTAPLIPPVRRLCPRLSPESLLPSDPAQLTAVIAALQRTGLTATAASNTLYALTC
jgi:hypothetical protein